MKECLKFYINGEWVDPVNPQHFDVINPATEESIGKIALGNEEDLNNAVSAAKNAFDSFSQTSKEERIELIGKILEVYQSRYDEIAETISGLFFSFRKTSSFFNFSNPFNVIGSFSINLFPFCQRGQRH